MQLYEPDELAHKLFHFKISMSYKWPACKLNLKYFFILTLGFLNLFYLTTTYTDIIYLKYRHIRIRFSNSKCTFMYKKLFSF